jgi:peptide deformylase
VSEIENILKWLDPSLFIKTRSVTDFSIVPSIVDQMVNTMKREKCIGLSANQIGIDYSVFILDNGMLRGAGCPLGDDDIFVAINPEVTMALGEKLVEDCCSSYPGVATKLMRSPFIVLDCMNTEGERVDFNCPGIAALAVQHEIDHLQGITVFTHSHADKQREIILMQGT